MSVVDEFKGHFSIIGYITFEFSRIENHLFNLNTEPKLRNINTIQSLGKTLGFLNGIVNDVKKYDVKVSSDFYSQWDSISKIIESYQILRNSFIHRAAYIPVGDEIRMDEDKVKGVEEFLEKFNLETIEYLANQFSEIIAHEFGTDSDFYQEFVEVIKKVKEEKDMHKINNKAKEWSIVGKRNADYLAEKFKKAGKEKFHNYFKNMSSLYED